MINKKITLTILFLTLTSLSFAESITEDEIRKALADITQIKVLDEQEPKVVSEIIVQEKEITTPQKSQKKKSYTKKSKKTYVSKKVTHKKIVRKKIVHKKAIPKKIQEVEDIDINDLPMAQTLGVISKSEPFTLEN